MKPAYIFCSHCGSEEFSLELNLQDDEIKVIPTCKQCLHKTDALALASKEDKTEILIDALTKLRDCDWVISLPDRMDAVRDIARKALLDFKLKEDK